MAPMDDAFTKHLPLVHSLVKRYRGEYAESEDLFQVGCIGLLKALKGFDPGRNTSFATYAVPFIAGEIKMYLRGQGTVKYSRAVKQQAGRVKKVQEELEQRLGRQPTLKELAAACQLEREEVLMALDASRLPLSLDVESQGQRAKLLAVPAETEEVIDRLALQEALNNLPERERQVMFYRYFRQQTQQQVAEILGLSQMQISRIERKVLHKLYRELSEEPVRTRS
ncbi:MAG: sigma-70 family RNA polymerase sigma factor [Firmicutes bacterium]|nr:sigma-70 family RNA polymerase sigma factor [Bacillota bacterium]